MNKCFLNAGHSLSEPGASFNNRRENALTIQLRDTLIPILSPERAPTPPRGAPPLFVPGFNTHIVPDTLDLRGSIDWVNQKATTDDFAYSCHFNANNNRNIRGVEAYYTAGNTKEMELAKIFARHVSQALGIPNRGAFPDTQTWVGSLGWLRKLTCDSVLIEVAYMTNDEDMRVYNPVNAAQGIRNALDEILGTRDKIQEQVEQLNFAQRALLALQEKISSLFNKV